MAPNPASIIPAEIRLHIFERCPDLATATSLARTCKSFNHVWNSYTEPILERIMPRSIVHYGYAQALASAQVALDEYRSSLKSPIHPVDGLQLGGLTLWELHEPGLGVLQSEPPVVVPTPPTSHRKLIPYILSHSKIVRSACGNLGLVEKHFHGNPFHREIDASRLSRIFPLTVTERDRFTLVYYRWRTLSVLLKHQMLMSESSDMGNKVLHIARDFFTSADERELSLIAQVATVLGRRVEIEHRCILATGPLYVGEDDNSLSETARPVYLHCATPITNPWDAANWAITMITLERYGRVADFACGLLVLLDDYQHLLRLA
ncbi:MAG: hypothetical protein Q9224_005824 [Gallowayella concinna]